MIVVLFRSKLVAGPDGYDAMAEEMDALARTMPGFVDVRMDVAEVTRASVFNRTPSAVPVPGARGEL
jgi:hypothetical protein